MLETLHDAKSFGFTFDNLQVDFGAAVQRSRGIVARQTKGVGFLMKKNKIDVIEGHGLFKDAHTIHVAASEFRPQAEARDVTAANIIIAVGARARSLPGTEIDGERIIQYRDALVLDDLPEKLIIVGSGAIGMEFGYVYGTYGVDVTIVEMLDQLLPLEDSDVAAEVAKEFKRKGFRLMTGTRTEQIEVSDSGVNVTVKNLKDEKIEVLSADKVLMAIGVQPNNRQARDSRCRRGHGSPRYCRDRRRDAYQRAASSPNGSPARPSRATSGVSTPISRTRDSLASSRVSPSTVRWTT